MPTKILIGVVTYNRLDLLKRCIRAIESQTISAKLLVINNSSTDGTQEYLLSHGIEHITQENLGSAGGWHRIIEYALHHHYDYVWMMDDDGFPEKHALENLIRTMSDEFACVSSVVVKELAPDEFVFKLVKLNKNNLPIIFSLNRHYKYLSQVKDMQTFEFAHLFNGALLNLKKVREIGNVNKEYFMYGDEVDYFFRLRKVGRVITNFNALHFHPDVGQRKIDDKKMYYYLRNTIFLNNKYFDIPAVRNFFTIGVALYRILKQSGIATLISYLVGNKRHYFYEAINDGYNKRIFKRF